MDERRERKVVTLRDGKYRYRHDRIRAFLAGCALAADLDVLRLPNLKLDINWVQPLVFGAQTIQSDDARRQLVFCTLEKSAQVAHRVFVELRALDRRLVAAWEDRFTHAYGPILLSNG